MKDDKYIKHIILLPMASAIISIALSGCETIDLNGPDRVRVKLVHAYTAEPVAGVTLVFTEFSPGIISGGNTVTRLEEITNSAGDVVFKSKSKQSGNVFSVNQDYYSYESQIFDSTDTHFKFTSEQLFIEYSQLDGHHTTKAKPNGRVYFFAKQDYWQNTGVDFVVVKSPFLQDTLSPYNSGIDFYVDPSETHTFNWYPVKNGVKETEQSKTLYVRNAWVKTSEGNLTRSPIRLEILP